MDTISSTYKPPTPPSDTVKWNDKITAPIIIPIVAMIVIVTFFICALIKCLKVTWDKKRRSDMYEITDLLPEKSKVLPESVAIDECDIELPNEDEKLHHRHVFMSNNSSPSPLDNDGEDNDEDNGIESGLNRSGKRPTGVAALKLLKFSNLRSIVTKKKMVSTTMSSQMVSSGEETVAMDIESGLESGTETSVTARTSIKQVNGTVSSSSGHESGHESGQGGTGTGIHDSSNDTNFDTNFDSNFDTNDSNFGDELEELDLEVPGYMNSNLDEVDTPSAPVPLPVPVPSSSNPLRKAPIALTESEV